MTLVQLPSSRDCPPVPEPLGFSDRSPGTCVVAEVHEAPRCDIFTQGSRSSIGDPSSLRQRPDDRRITNDRQNPTTSRATQRVAAYAPRKATASTLAQSLGSIGGFAYPASTEGAPRTPPRRRTVDGRRVRFAASPERSPTLAGTSQQGVNMKAPFISSLPSEFHALPQFIHTHSVGTRTSDSEPPAVPARSSSSRATSAPPKGASQHDEDLERFSGNMKMRQGRGSSEKDVVHTNDWYDAPTAPWLSRLGEQPSSVCRSTSQPIDFRGDARTPSAASMRRAMSAHDNRGATPAVLTSPSRSGHAVATDSARSKNDGLPVLLQSEFRQIPPAVGQVGKAPRGQAPTLAPREQALRGPGVHHNDGTSSNVSQVWNHNGSLRALKISCSAACRLSDGQTATRGTGDLHGTESSATSARWRSHVQKRDTFEI